jgi:hypothetical protein
LWQGGHAGHADPGGIGGFLRGFPGRGLVFGAQLREQGGEGLAAGGGELGAVIETGFRRTLLTRPPRGDAPAGPAAFVEQGDIMAGLGQMDRAGEAGNAGADHGIGLSVLHGAEMGHSGDFGKALDLRLNSPLLKNWLRDFVGMSIISEFIFLLWLKFIMWIIEK